MTVGVSLCGSKELLKDGCESVEEPHVLTSQEAGLKCDAGFMRGDFQCG